MTKNDKFFNIIDEVATVAMMMQRGCKFVEISTYFRNHVPGITDEEVSVICEVLYPMQRRIREDLKNRGLLSNI
jgi:hypothetical protein